MVGRRATAVACVVAPLSYLVAQVLIASMEDAATTLQRIAASGSA